MAQDRYDVFLSHAGADKPAVLELARRLEARGVVPWIDAWNLIPGEPWQAAIEEALERSAACAVCLGPGGSGPWQNAEMRAALSRQHASGRMRVIPVLLPGAERGERSRLPPFLAENTWVELRQGLDDEAALHRLVCGIRGIEPGPGPGEAVTFAGAAPYRGLDVFRVEDAPFFFGREALVGWLLDKLRPGRAASRLLALVGPSGSGKSSLARAGLLAALQKGEEIAGSDSWPVAVCRPGEHPLEDLALALGGTAADLPERLRGLAANPRMLHLTVRLALQGAPPERRFVLLVDPLEPLFTRSAQEDERRAFLANLLEAAAAADGPTVVILTLRSDFLGAAAAYPDLAAALSDRQVVVGPMSSAELRRAIEKPAHLAGGELEGGLTDLLLRDVENQKGGLPLLEHALRELWERRQGRRMTLAAYEAIGGIAGALDRHAEEVFTSFAPAEQEICRKVFLRLVQVGQGVVATRRFRTLDELVPSGSPPEERARIEGVVRQLADARLLTTEGEKGVAQVTLAHESLIGHWKKLGEWIEGDRAALRLRDQLGEALAKWQESRDPSDLYRGVRLAQAEEWDQAHPGELNQLEKDFLAECLALRGEEGRRERERARRLKRLVVGLAVAGGLALVAFGIATYQKLESINRKNLILASYLASRAEGLVETSPTVALLLAREAMHRAENGGDTRLPAAESALRSALSHLRGMPLGQEKIAASFVTADRRSLVTAGRDGQIRLWDLTARNIPESGKLLVMALEQIASGGLALSADRRWLLTLDKDGQALLRDLRTGRQELLRHGEAWIPGHDPFSADSQWLATHEVGRPSLRNLKAPTRIFLPINPAVSVMAFSPDSRLLAVGARGEPIALFDLQAGAKAVGSQFQLEDSRSAIDLSWSADGARLAAGVPLSTGGIVSPRLWSIKPGGSSPIPLMIEGCTAISVLLSPDGRWLASDRCLWSLDTSAVPSPRRQHYNFVAAAFSTDSRRLAKLDQRGAVTLLDLKTLATSPLVLADVREVEREGLVEPAQSLISLSADNRWLVVQGLDEPPRKLELEGEGARVEPATLRWASGVLALSANSRRALLGERLLFDLQRSRSEGTSIDFSGDISTWSFSDDGVWIAGGGMDGRVFLWHLDPQGKMVALPPLKGHQAAATALAFSRPVRWLASGDESGRSLVWDLQNPTQKPLALTNHEGRVSAFAFRPGTEEIATAGLDGRVRLHRFEAPVLLTMLPTRSSSATALAFSPDGRWLAMAQGDGKVVAWRPEGKEEVALGSRDTTMRMLAFSHDGKWLTSGGAIAQLWRFEGRKTATLPIVLPRLKEKELFGTPSRFPRVVTMAFSEDNEHLIAADSSGTSTSWDLRLEHLLGLACQAAGRNLTRAEWKEYLPSEAYRKRSPCPELPPAPE